MSIRLMYIVEAPFSERDYHRFFVEQLQERGFQILVVDLTPLYNSRFDEQFSSIRLRNSNIISCTSFITALKHIRRFKPHFVWNFTLPHVNCYFMRFALSAYLKFTSKVIEYNVLAGPFCLQESVKRSNFGKFLRNAFARAVYFPFIFTRPHYSYIGGTSGYKTSVGKPIHVHYLDYDLFLKASRQATAKKDPVHLLFLDGDYAFHPDYAHAGLKAPVTPECYYREMNEMLASIASHLKMDVVIQLHPRANRKRSSEWYKYRFSENDTATAVLAADLVVTHDSTAVQFAVLAQKPITFIETSELEHNHFCHANIHAFASALDTKVLGPRDFPFRGSVPAINLSAYAKYVETYIKSPQSPIAFSYEIMAEELKKIHQKKRDRA